MIKELQLRILPEEAVNEQSLRQVVARETGEAPKNIRAVRVLKRSIDAQASDDICQRETACFQTRA